MKVEAMSRRAMKVVEEGKLKFYPQSWTKPYLMWLENLRDWCISRQIWWGHRIPIYYCVSENSKTQVESLDKRPVSNCPPIAATETPKKCPACGGTHFEQDPDVLDTWFSSALWPFSVFGWPDNRPDKANTGPVKSDIEYFYPTSVLCTGHEILYLWVARMVQMGLEFLDEIPFKEVFIHGIVRDKAGKKMSKSLGNVIDPLSIMEKYGTDALRFSMAQSAAPGRDMQLSDDSFVSARNFANKIWNASRFILMNASGVKWEKGFIMSVWPMELADRWILSEYRITVRDVTKALETYDIDVAARLLYEFFWSKYCDWYIELAKIRMNGENEPAKKAALSMLMELLSGILRMLHPIMPFITEELWQNLGGYFAHDGKNKSILTAPWPESDESKIDNVAIKEMGVLQEFVTAIRTVRSEMGVPPGKMITALVKAPSAEQKTFLEVNSQYIKTLAKIEKFEIGEGFEKPKQSAAAVAAGFEIIIPLAGIIDMDKELKRLQKDLASAEADQERCEKKFENEDFVKRAPETEILKMKERLAAAKQKVEHLKESIKTLQ
jgi:valyl-tRNA synthetase